MASKSSVRTRALAPEASDVGMHRFNLYKSAFDRINAALADGYHLEAITLIESLITDRLESRLTYVKKSDFSFKTLGAVISETRRVEPDTDLKNLVSDDLDSWRKARNKAIHELVKLSDTDTTPWTERTKTLAPTCKEGYRILRAIDKRMKTLRRKV
jgi:hypothetical protein